MPRRTMWMQALLCREIIVLPGACIWSLSTLTSTYRQFIICLLLCLFVKISYHPDFVFKYHILQLYNMLMGFLNHGRFYHSCPFAGNKQSVHIVSFPAGRTSSHHSAGHTMIQLFNFWNMLIICAWTIFKKR